MTESTAGPQGANASGMRQEMRRHCTDKAVSAAEPAREKGINTQVRAYSARRGYPSHCPQAPGSGVATPPVVAAATVNHKQ